jgi:LPS-assembly protein
LLTTFNNLFRGQEFTGLDRINDNNQFTFGATARLIDEKNREKLVLSIGQIFYLEDSELISSVRDNDRSALAAEFDWQVNQRWFLHSDIQVATQTQKVERSSVATEYRIDDNRFIQLNHRYIRDLSGEEINQFGVSASWPISKEWHWVGRWYRDAELSRTTESFVGIQYESCCWALRMTYQRNLSNRFDDAGARSTNEFDSGFGLQFVIKGIGSGKRNSDILEQGMFGYRQPYVLN